ncbi:hypothetical protein MYVALT_F_03250 [Candidatus Vallotia tarda]|uniref:Uncharacterized protein n=1 Tax=Candidatus Vallotiella hemipterorum TaxID=1177213 RepID=A0A916NV25_9BURK|nr:hypothetical protein MYVALT_F_03250 [Candidatus Vallotia tarda]
MIHHCYTNNPVKHYAFQYMQRIAVHVAINTAKSVMTGKVKPYGARCELLLALFF